MCLHKIQGNQNTFFKTIYTLAKKTLVLLEVSLPNKIMKLMKIQDHFYQRISLFFISFSYMQMMTSSAKVQA